MCVKGSITVFISLLMTIILSFSSAICESIRFRGAKIAGICAADAASESAMAKYDIKLLEEFGIFGAYYEDEEAFLSSVLMDVEKNLYPEQEFLLLKDSDFWQLTAVDICANEYCLMTDNCGAEYFNQAIIYAKNNLAAELADMLISYVESNEDPESIKEYFENKEQETDKQIDEYEKQAESGEYEADYVYEGEIIEVEKSPVEVVKQIKQSGILSLTIPGAKEISGNYVDISACVSGRNLNTGTDKDLEESSLKDKALYIEYLSEMFTDFNNRSDLEAGFNYELEYCIGGKETDEANLKAVVNRLLLIKEATNFSYLMTDSVKKNQALAVAAGLVGATGMQVLVEAVKYAILLAWAYAESIVDVRNLLNGGSSALVKTAENWKLGIENIGGLVNISADPVKEKYGLDYNSYLKLLMLFIEKDELVMRGMDLTELRLQQIYDKSDYHLDKLLASANISVFYKSKPIFLNFGFIKNYNYNSDFNVTSKYTYI